MTSRDVISEGVSLQLKQAQTYAACQQWQLAITACQQVLKLNPHLAEAYQIWGNSLQKLGQSPQAIQCYLKVVELQPEQPEVYANLGKLYAQSEQWLKALQYYEQCLALSPIASVYRSAAKIWSIKGDSERAWLYFCRALELEPEIMTPQQCLKAGNKFWQEQKAEEALVFYRHGIKLDPGLSDAYPPIIQILQHLGREQEAKQYIQAALGYHAQGSETETEAKSAHQRGDALSKQEDWQGAVAAYQKAIALKPDFSWSHNNLGDVYLKLNQCSAAVESYRRAIALKSDFFWSYQNLGEALFKLEQWTEAVAAYQRAIALDASFYWSHYNLGECLSKLFHWSEAIESYQQAIALKPDLAEAYAHLGDALIRQEDWSGGIQYYEQAIELNPGIDVAVYRSLKEALDRRKYLAQASTVNPVAPPRWPFDPVSVYPPFTTLPDGSPLPKISIVTPTYNQGQFIEETILSVIQQNYPNLEYILVDGKSTDGTMEVVEKYRQHFSYIVSEADQGQSNAINKGFRQATGEIFTWLNSDDRLAPGALYAMALAFYSSGADAVAGVCQIFQDGREIEQHLTSCANGTIPLEDILDLENCWLQGKFFYQPEVMFTREIWEKAGGQVDESLYYSMDYEMWARFAAQGATLQVIGYPVAQYRLHEQQKTSEIAKYQPELLQVRESLQQSFEIAPTTKPALKRQKLKIVVLNDTGFLGGAGIAHHRLAQALELAGHQVFPLAGTLDWSLTPVSCTAAEVEALVASLEPDLLLIGNIHNFQSSLNILETLIAKYPTVFVMHDQWLLTGRCGYTGDCTKYQVLCDADCPTWDRYPCLAPSKIATAFESKQALLSNDQLVILGDSRWLRDWAQQTYSRREVAKPVNISNIHYGLDTQVFSPQGQTEARRQLGLPEDKFIILTGSQSLEDERKGFKHLLAALEIANLDNLLLLCFGHDFQLNLTLDIQSVGYVNSPKMLSYYYSAADLFISPAQEEAFGQTFIEAAACGTPAVGFAVGGVIEAIGDRLTGRLVQSKTANALARMITELYTDRAQLKLLSQLAPWYIASNFSMTASYHSVITSWSQSGLLAKLGMAAVSKFTTQNIAPNKFLTVKGGNPQNNVSVGLHQLPLKILLDESLQGSGWFPAEKVQEDWCRWMKKSSSVLIQPLNSSSALKLEIMGITAVDLQLLEQIKIKFNGNLLETRVKHGEAGNWVCQSIIPVELIASGAACLLAIEVEEVRQLSPTDSRHGSLLINSIVIDRIK
ncbi:MAG: tetratricopeptide repeat protein [Cyanobacteria bacterium P01_C01_bin.72]